MSSKNPVTATLVRGQTFILGQQIFTAGKAIPVTPETKAYLRQHAIDVVTYAPREDGDEPELREYQKFRFSDDEEAAQ